VAVPAASLRADVTAAWREGLRVADPRRACSEALQSHPHLDPSRDGAIVVAIGKAAAAMASALPAGARGFVLCPHGVSASGLPHGMAVEHGAHPVPDAAGLASSRRILAAVTAAGGRRRLLVLLSGGASALFEVARTGIGDGDLIATYRALLGCGADIQQINLLRRRLSAVKGGGLAAAARPARVDTLVVSDVIGDDPRIIGSGPTVPWVAEPARVAAVLEDFGLDAVLPEAVVRELRRVAERPGSAAGPGEYLVVAGLGASMSAARAWLREHGYRCIDGGDGDLLAGDCEAAAHELAARVRRHRRDGGRAALVLGGETTVRLPAHAGEGGRCQHMAARIALELRGEAGFACIAAGTDGRDGLSEAAGAVVDASSAARAQACGARLEDALARFDSGSALEASGDAFFTGPTGTNVGDLVVFAWHGTAQAAREDCG